MSLNGVCIRSVFEQKIGPYKVCIFVNMGPYGKVAALDNVTCVIKHNCLPRHYTEDLLSKCTETGDVDELMSSSL